LYISHPDRVVDASTGVTKLDIAHHYAKVAHLMLPYLKGRPVALVRAPDGIAGELFFQKHMDKMRMDGILDLDPALDQGHAPLMEVLGRPGLLAAAQMNVVEFHTWNARKDSIDRPDRMAFDLDPGEGVPWSAVQEGAELVRVLLSELGLPAYLKTSGGKGLHVVVPVKRLHGWDAVKSFSRAIVQHLAATIPGRFVARSGPRNRVGKIFVDYLRNGRGATTVAAWSARARPGLGVSVPLGWDELADLTSSTHWTVRTVEERMATGNAPWEGYDKASVSLGAAMRQLGFRPGQEG
jgi:bifunctional non-homologous end joining protein LigD